MDAILQTFFDAFSLMKNFEIQLNFFPEGPINNMLAVQVQ